MCLELARCIDSVSDDTLASFRSGIEEGDPSEIDILLGDLDEWDVGAAEEAETASKAKASKASLVQEGKQLRDAAKRALSPANANGENALASCRHTQSKFMTL